MTDTSPLDDDMAAAQALVRSLESLRWKAKTLTDELERTKKREERWRKSYWMVNDERGQWLKRRWAVESVHHEAYRVTCGDGCCTEELGYCSYDNEPYPCRTIQALDKEPEEWPAAPEESA